jgi:hypothetical protein
MREAPSVAVGDEVELRKPHACGANRWVVVRTGADVRLRCSGCGHTVLLPRDQFNRAVRKVAKRAPGGEP